MRLIFTVIVLLLIIVSIFLAFPYVWKSLGGTFMWGRHGVVYQGRLLVKENKNCSFSWSNDFKEIKQYCPTPYQDQNYTVRIWINGIEQNLKLNR